MKPFYETDKDQAIFSQCASWRQEQSQKHFWTSWEFSQKSEAEYNRGIPRNKPNDDLNFLFHSTVDEKAVIAAYNWKNKLIKHYPLKMMEIVLGNESGKNLEPLPLSNSSVISSVTYALTSRIKSCRRSSLQQLAYFQINSMNLLV